MIKSVDVGWKVFSTTMVHNSSHLYIIFIYVKQISMVHHQIFTYCYHKP